MPVSYLQIERHKEERRMLAGIASNRNVGLEAYGSAPADDTPADETELGELSSVRRIMGIDIPPPQDDGVVPRYVKKKQKTESHITQPKLTHVVPGVWAHTAWNGGTSNFCPEKSVLRGRDRKRQSCPTLSIS